MAAKQTRKAARLSPESRTAEILLTARILLREVGYENFLPADVARRCGVSEATIYRYFPTRRDLLVRVAEEWFGEILAVEPELAGLADTFERLRHVIWHGLSVVKQEPVLTRFVLTVLRTDPLYRSMDIYQLNRRFTSAVTKVVEEAITSGAFRANVSPNLVRDMIFGAIEHQTWAFLRGEGDFSIDEAADGIAEIIFRGLTAAPPTLLDVASALRKLERAAQVVETEVRRLGGLLGKGQR